MKTLKIGLFGCGTVGSGVYRILTEQRGRIARETGVDIEIAHVCVRHPEKERDVVLPREIVTTDAEAVLDDPTIDVIIEVIGGERDALGIIARALTQGRNVVTANKDVVARYLPELRTLEDLHGGHLFYGASVCGSVPILKIIDETLLTDRVTALRGVVNGSCGRERLGEWLSGRGVGWHGGFRGGRCRRGRRGRCGPGCRGCRGARWGRAWR
jgi:homoserine dehydrogenase